MKQIQLMALLLAAAGLTACSSDEGTGEAPLKMIVDVTESPFTDTSFSAKMRGTTRATSYTTTESLSDFSMNYMESTYAFKKEMGSWNTNNWPTSNPKEKIDLYAYTHGTYNYNGGNPYITFTVKSGDHASDQQDLLVAEHKEISYNDAGGHVSLSFDHALAAVQFKVKITNTLKTNLEGSNLTVNSIVLRNVYNSGDYYYNTKSWASLSNSPSNIIPYYTLTDGAFTVTTDYKELPCGYLFLIPQNREVSIAVEYEYTLKDQTKTKVADIPFTVEWESGYIYPIEIKLGTGTIKLD